MEIITQVNNSINGFVWGMFGLVLLIGTGILMTARTGFFQVTRLKHWFKHTLGSLFSKNVISHTKEKGAISPFQALCTAWQLPWAPETSPACRLLSVLAAQALCSGCGSLPSSA